MSEAKHIVNRIAINTSGIAAANAFQWRARVSTYLREKFPRQLQKVLDELFAPDEQIRIHRLDLNVSLAKAEGTDLFERELTHALRSALIGQKLQVAPKKMQDHTVSGSTALNRSLAAWFFYLQKGYYPWYHQQVLRLKELAFLIEEQAAGVTDQLPDILNSVQAQQRFLLQAKEEILRLWLPCIVTTATPTVLLKERISGIQIAKHQVAGIQQLLIKLIVNREQMEERVLLEMIASINDPVERPPGKNIKEKAGLKQLPEENSFNPGEEKDASIWIQNAGLVLLHPFLPVLFDRLSVLNEEKRIIDMEKALSLIHYLLYADEEYTDASMVLPKILCGIAYHDPVPINFLINSDEREECDELLLSVIKYWDILKNTSVKGLLEAFVLRKGKLTPGEKGWLLQVEVRTEDILLDRLPWSISYIKLPWTATVLTTEWR